MRPHQSKKKRLKRNELVSQIFSAFSRRYEETGVDSVYRLVLSLEDVRAELQDRYETEYNSDEWILTQLRRYEREVGEQLFEKVDIGPNGNKTAIAVYPGITSFARNHHLYVNQKMRIANGVVDAISHLAAARSRNRPLRLLLGSGSLPMHVAQVFITRDTARELVPCEIYTHNIGIVELLLSYNDRRYQLFSPGGRADHDTNTFLGEDDTLFTDTEFDFVVQSTPCVSDGRLYVESEEQLTRKRNILHATSGTKMLLLIKDEFVAPPDGMHHFGSLADYDYIVTIPSRPGAEKTADEYLDVHSEVFSPYIVHWSYTIYRVNAESRRGRNRALVGTFGTPVRLQGERGASSIPLEATS